MGMLFVEEFVLRVLNTDRELTALDYFQVFQRLTPVERDALWLRYKEEEREEQLRAPRDWEPFELFEDEKRKSGRTNDRERATLSADILTVILSRRSRRKTH